MAYREIVEIGNDVLRKHCKKQEKFDHRLRILLKDMADTMYEADGVGLAAPQVGILRRVVVMDVGDDNGLIEMVNPEITYRSEETQTGREGCLSLPGRQAVVTRPMTVTVKFQDRNGEEQELTGSGLLARCICHELAHLDGELYIDVMDRELTKEEMESRIPEDPPEEAEGEE
ncbi:MAG: peptide deformylase [Clostridia bacterium]|nr:peptide deformylase [Clostridia bacterium]